MRFHPARVVLGLALLAFGLRVFRLDAFSLRGDEAFTVLFVQQPFAQMWDGIRTIEPNPPLLYLLLRGWIAVAGASEFATRFFALFWGVLCVPLLYRLARAVLTLPAASHEAAELPLPVPWTAVAAAFLIAINPYQVWHSQDVRNYTLWPALSLAGLVWFFRWVGAALAAVPRSPRTPGASLRPAVVSPLLPYVLFSLASLYTHYYDAFLLVAQNLLVLIVLWRRWRAWAQWALAQMLLAAFYLPWVLVFSDRATAYGEGSGIQGLGLLQIAARSFAAFVAGETLPEGWRAYLWIAFALVALAALVFLARTRSRAAWWLGLYVAVPTVAVWGLNLFRPLFLERYLNGVAPAYYVLVATGLTSLVARVTRGTAHLTPRRASRPSLPGAPAWGLPAVLVLLPVAAAAVALGHYWYDPAFAKAPDWRALMRTIAAESRPGDVILQNFPEMASFYYARAGMPRIEVEPREFFPDARTESQLAVLTANYDRIWFIPAAPDFWDPDRGVETWLNSRADLMREDPISTFRLRLYATAREFLPARTPVSIRLGEFATLIGYRRAQERGDTLLSLYWQPVKGITQSYTAFAHALGPDGRVLAQQDNPPVNGARPTSSWKPEELIVDQYRLAGTGANVPIEVGMYDPRTMTRVPLYDGAGSRLPEDRLLIKGQ